MTKKQTPLNKLIRRLEEYKGDNLPHASIDALNVAILDAKVLLSEERQMVIDAYYAGTSQFANEAEIINPKTPELYFTDTYGKEKE